MTAPSTNRIPDAHGTNGSARVTGLLGDSPTRDYTGKLKLFAAFAAPELRAVIQELDLRPGMRVLDAGCGTGEALSWLAEAVTPQGAAVGLDLSSAHVAAARGLLASHADAAIFQGDLLHAPFASHSFDLVWSINTLNHLHDPVNGIRALAALTRPHGKLVLGQSSLLPEMCFAWDARLERVTNEAVRHYYRDKYCLSERSLTGVRALVGWAREANLRDVNAQTIVIERIYPLRPADHAYVLQAIFRETWGQRLKPYMSIEDYRQLQDVCDPESSAFALSRRDFHYVQTLTLVTGNT
jgi:SAM-dependent methyltransferase